MTQNGPGSDGIEPGRPAVRASDGDRQRVADLLREHTSAGRLTIEEYEQRLDAALAAKTVVELRPLLIDLPVPLDDVLPLATVPPTAPARQVAHSDAAGMVWLRVPLFVVALVVLGAGVLLLSRGMAWPLVIGGLVIFGGRRGHGHPHRHHR